MTGPVAHKPGRLPGSAPFSVGRNRADVVRELLQPGEQPLVAFLVVRRVVRPTSPEPLLPRALGCLSFAEARSSLTVHGVNQNEDGTYRRKVDNYVRALPPYDMRLRDIQILWSRIASPTLLLYGKLARLRHEGIEVRPLWSWPR
jgi:hypothetical protein